MKIEKNRAFSMALLTHKLWITRHPFRLLVLGKMGAAGMSVRVGVGSYFRKVGGQSTLRTGGEDPRGDPPPENFVI
jgi:hypothetical protein